MARNPTILDRVYWQSPYAVQSLATTIRKHLKLLQDNPSEVALVCIGTDRSTGDALGPIIGSEIAATNIRGLHVYGTLDEPVHAANLEEKLGEIEARHPGVTIIAIDACLGKAENVGYITAKSGPLRPGTGVNKNLPSVGDMHIIGTVNVGGFMEYLVLQNTRLSLVMNMARVIYSALSLALRSHLGYAETSVSEDV
ncbi:MAG: spore protease YyaC [Firmicutes bacterium]|nr:spore protease YyaC [Bacillota bacterium]